MEFSTDWDDVVRSQNEHGKIGNVKFRPHAPSAFRTGAQTRKIARFPHKTHQNRRKPAHFPLDSLPERKCANLRRFARKKRELCDFTIWETLEQHRAPSDKVFAIFHPHDRMSDMGTTGSHWRRGCVTFSGIPLIGVSGILNQFRRIDFSQCAHGKIRNSTFHPCLPSAFRTAAQTRKPAHFSHKTHQNRHKPAHFPLDSLPERKCANLRRFARKNSVFDQFCLFQRHHQQRDQHDLQHDPRQRRRYGARPKCGKPKF